jgi:membrane protease YdiL (CAAX protease family)
MSQALTSSDRRVIAIAIVVAGISLAIGVKYFSHAFPEAAIQFRVNRNDSTPLATRFIADRGWNVSRYRHAAVFDYDDNAKVYLERTQGLARMNALTRGPVHLWHWSHRWFKPQQIEEFRVDVTPAGQVVGFDRELPETAPGANLDAAAARAIAEKFLGDVMHRDMANLEFVDSVSQKRPARTDYSFTWKQKDVDLGDGSLRVETEVDGDAVGSYREYVKVPEGWTRDYEKLRSRNTAANVVDEVPWILICIAGLVLLIQRLRRRDVPIYLALGFALVAGVLYFLGQLNMFSQAEFGYRTTDSYSSFLSGYVVDNLLVALAFAALIFLLVASTEPIYREGYPQHLSIRRYFTWQGLRTRSFFIANVVGIALTFFFFAYQTVFYLAANKLGAWAPADVPFSDLLNTRFPWVMVLFVGFFPAVSEEIQFRAFAIPFLRKFLRSAPLAIVLPAFIWGFLHSAYPNQPFFIRGLEVGFGGIIIGLIMLRFGILATLIWHYSVDALYTAFLLLRSPNHYLMISGAVSAGIMLVPLVVALGAYWKTGTFTEESPLLNAAEPTAEPPAEVAAAAEAPLAYQPLSRNRLMAAGVLAVIFAALAFIPVYRFGKGIVLHKSAQDAVLAADNFLRQRKVDPAKYRHAAWIHDNVDGSTLDYLAERKPLEQADKIYRQATHLVLWAVRYFRPLQKEEYQVFVDPVSGEVCGFRHVLEENAPGASLSPDQAQALAEQAVREHGYPLEDFELQSSDATKRKAREDYTLVWQAKPGDPRNVGDAHYRLAVDVAGDQVVGFSRFFKLPEDWERKQEGTTIFNNVLLGVSVLTVLSLVAAGLILFVNLVRSGQMQWKRSAIFGVVIAGLGVLGALNGLPLIYRTYDTSMPLPVWKLLVAVSLTVVPLVEGLFAWLLVGCAVSLYPDAWNLFRSAARQVWRRDALVALVLSLAAAAGLARFDALLVSVFHAHAPIQEELFPATLATRWPAAGFFINVISRTLLLSGAVALAIFILRAGWKRRAWWLWVGLALVLVSLGPSHAHSLAEYGVGWLMMFVPLLVACLVVGLFLRNNLLAYVMVFFCTQVASPMVDLFAQSNPFFLQNGVVLAVLAAAVLAWMVWPANRVDAGKTDVGAA